MEGYLGLKVKAIDQRSRSKGQIHFSPPCIPSGGLKKDHDNLIGPLCASYNSLTSIHNHGANNCHSHALRLYTAMEFPYMHLISQATI